MHFQTSQKAGFQYVHTENQLNRIYDWQHENNMLFNVEQFELFRYGTNEDIKESTNYLTPEYEDIIEVNENLRDLGIIMSDDATLATTLLKYAPKSLAA